MTQKSALMLALVVVAGFATTLTAGEHCCSCCGCAQQCRRVCRLVVEEKKIETVCWGSKCEFVCIPGPSCEGCEHCESVCGTCESNDPTAPRAEPKRLLWKEWFPGSAKVYTRKKLLKKTVTTKVPSHKWVVEDLCAKCYESYKKTGSPGAAAEPEKAGLADVTE
jgi:hypothetical protein